MIWNAASFRLSNGERKKEENTKRQSVIERKTSNDEGPNGRCIKLINENQIIEVFVV